MLAAALLLTAALSAASPAEKELLLGADFETGYDAAYSRGSGRAVLPESLRRIPAAGALALPPQRLVLLPGPQQHQSGRGDNPVGNHTGFHARRRQAPLGLA